MLGAAFPRSRWLGRLAVAAIVVALAVLSWLPPRYEEPLRPGWAGQIDHVVAYLVAALVSAVALRRMPWWLLCAGFSAFAVVLEVGQAWVPGRTSQAIDAAASIVGAAVGCGLGAWLRSRRGRPGSRTGRAAVVGACLFGVVAAAGLTMLLVGPP